MLVYLRDGSAQFYVLPHSEVADPTFYLTQSRYTDTGPTSPKADPTTPDAWQGSHWSANFWVTGVTRLRKKSRRKRDSNPGSSALEADALPLGQRGGGRGRVEWDWEGAGGGGGGGWEWESPVSACLGLR